MGADQNPHPRVPDKAEGKAYSVVMRSEGFSFMNVAAKGAVGGSDVYPNPRLGQQCVCCNCDTDRRQEELPMDPGGHFKATEPLSVPICEACAEHALAKTNLGIVAVGGCLVGGALAYLGFASYDSLAMALAGLALFVGGALWLFLLRQKRLSQSHFGHHPGLELMISPKQLVVRTYNRSLAERVASLNADHVKRVI